MTWTLKKQLEQRLAELEEEYESGQKFLAELEERKSSVNETLLRITGALQVLKEELDKAAMAEQDGGQSLSQPSRPMVANVTESSRPIRSNIE
jgi:predicted nuclease with TOPRIM domain